MTILVTGGAGYIGSHTLVELLGTGQQVVVLDNLSNSSPESLKRVEQITGKAVTFVKGDILDRACLQRLFAEYRIESVIHFAGLKAVGESVAKPIEYYDNNLYSTLVLLKVMKKYNVKKIIFSSSATVYGEPAALPIREDFARSATNPYGWTKLMMEQVLTDLDARAPGQWRIARLRYFNPVGAHESGLIGEDPRGEPNNLMPYVAQVAAGQRERLNVYGDDYPTPDGTGLRDYIHVCDLAEGHMAALRYLRQHAGLLTVNLGTGRPVSVLEMVRSFERASGRTVPYRVAPRRPGDVAACWADPSLAERQLGWRARRSVENMCADAWRWQRNVTHAED